MIPLDKRHAMSDSPRHEHNPEEGTSMTPAIPPEVEEALRGLDNVREHFTKGSRAKFIDCPMCREICDILRAHLTAQAAEIERLREERDRCKDALEQHLDRYIRGGSNGS